MGKPDSELLSVDNVEEAIDKAINKYQELGMIIDMLFWSSAIKLLKEKLKKGEKR